MPTLKYQIEQYMDKNRITKYELAKRAGISSSRVYDIFAGRKPATHATMLKFLEALNLEYNYTITEKK